MFRPTQWDKLVIISELSLQELADISKTTEKSAICFGEIFWRKKRENEYEKHKKNDVSASNTCFFLQKMRKHFKHIVCALFILTVHSLFSSQASISQAISKGWSIIVMWPDLWHSFHQLQNEITENNWNNFKVECLKRLLKN